MQKYSNNVQDQFGNELTGATIEVRNVVGGALSVLFSDDGVTPKANPFVSPTSEFFFYAGNGRYDIFITGTVIDEDLDNLLYDPASGGSVIPDGTIEGTTLYWDNTGGAWLENVIVRFDDVGDALEVRNPGDLATFIKLDWRTAFNARLDLGSNKVGSAADILCPGQLHVYNTGSTAIFRVHAGPISTSDYISMDHNGIRAQIFTGAAMGLIEMFANNGSDDIQFVNGSGVYVRDGAYVRIAEAADVDDVEIDVNIVDLAPFKMLSFRGTAGIEGYNFDEDVNVQGDIFLGTNRIGFYAKGDSVSHNIVPDSGDLQIQVVANSLRVFADSIRVKESAVGNVVDIATWGQYYVESEGDNVPVFKSDAGTIHLLTPSRSDVNEQNGNYTFVLQDLGKTIRKASGGAGETYTIPAEGSVAYKIGTWIAIDNDGGGDLSIAITTDVLVGTDGTTGTRTLGDNERAVIQKIASARWRYMASDL